IVVMEPSEHRKRDDTSAGTGASRGGRNRDTLPEPLVRPACVEVRDVLEQYGSQVTFPEDDDEVEAFAADAAEEALAGGVHERCADGCLEDANARAVRDAVEVRAELGVAIADDEARPCSERRQLAKLLRG